MTCLQRTSTSGRCSVWKDLSGRGRRALVLVLLVMATIATSFVPACLGRNAPDAGVRASAPRVGQGAPRPVVDPAPSSDDRAGGVPSPSITRRRRETREDGAREAGEWISDLARE